jgi:uncharacterized membrane protein YkvA (DUF1232 family)
VSIRERIARAARGLKTQTYALVYAIKDPETPWYAKAIAAVVVAYAFSPIDLIPDFIPVLGLLDDLLLVPLGIALALRLVPRAVMERAREQARARVAEKRKGGWVMGGIIIAVWVALVALVVFAIVRRVAARR